MSENRCGRFTQAQRKAPVIRPQGDAAGGLPEYPQQPGRTTIFGGSFGDSAREFVARWLPWICRLGAGHFRGRERSEPVENLEISGFRCCASPRKKKNWTQLGKNLLPSSDNLRVFLLRGGCCPIQSAVSSFSIFHSAETCDSGGGGVPSVSFVEAR